MRKSTSYAAALTAWVAVSCTSAAADTLIGSNVTLTYTIGPNTVLGNVTTVTTDTFSVTNGTEITCTGLGAGNANVCSLLTSANQYIDVGATTIRYDYINATTPSSFLPAHP